MWLFESHSLGVFVIHKHYGWDPKDLTEKLSHEIQSKCLSYKWNENSV